MRGLTKTAVMFLLIAPAMLPVDLDNCSRPACAQGDRWDGAVCQSGPAPITGARSHYRPTCPSGWELNSSAGTCVEKGCTPACELPACGTGERYADGDCESSSGLNYRSHHVATCPDGYDLVRSRGVCARRDCAPKPVTAMPIHSPQPPPVALPQAKAPGIPAQVALPQPDLAVLGFALLRHGTSCMPKEPIATMSVRIRNVGTAPLTRSVRVSVYDEHDPSWVNYADLPVPIEVGFSRILEIPILYKVPNPRHMIDGAPHPFHARVDPDNRVVELSESNNVSSPINLVAPAACSGVRLW